MKERLTKRTEKTRQKAFAEAFNHAAKGIDDSALKPLLNHRPFREEVVKGQFWTLCRASTSRLWGKNGDWRLDAHAVGLRRFFNALEIALLADETWGPILKRFQDLRFRRDVLKALEEKRLDTPMRQIVLAVQRPFDGRRGHCARRKGPGRFWTGRAC